MKYSVTFSGGSCRIHFHSIPEIQTAAKFVFWLPGSIFIYCSLAFTLYIIYSLLAPLYDIKSIGKYFYFSNNILFDFPSSEWFNFFVVDLVLVAIIVFVLG